MKLNKLVLGSILGSTLLAGGVLIAAGQPGENVGHRHQNLMAAQHLIDQAYERIVEAQRANEWDMGGHASRAKELLDQANREIKLAAQDANHHGH